MLTLTSLEKAREDIMVPKTRIGTRDQEDLKAKEESTTETQPTLRKEVTLDKALLNNSVEVTEVVIDRLEDIIRKSAGQALALATEVADSTIEEVAAVMIEWLHLDREVKVSSKVTLTLFVGGPRKVFNHRQESFQDEYVDTHDHPRGGLHIVHHTNRRGMDEGGRPGGDREGYRFNQEY